MEPFDKMLRSALMDAARAEWEQVMEEPQPEPEFSARYLRERKRLLKDPFGYAKRKSRPMWKKVLQTAASIVLVAGIGLGGVLAVSPEARAWVAQQMSVIWGDKFAVFTVSERQEGFADVCNYRPAYIPDGFELMKEWIPNEFFIKITYEDEAGDYIYYKCASLSDKGISDFVVDNEHSDSYEIQINGLPATLMLSNIEGWPSHLVWMDGENGVAYCITATLDREELIQIAESVTYLIEWDGVGFIGAEK